MTVGLQGLPGMLQHHPGSHWEYQWAGSSHHARMEVLEMPPCGWCLQHLPLLGSSTRRHLGLSGGDEGRGLPGLEGSWDPSQPGPLAAPRIGTGNRHIPYYQPSAGARGQRWPPLALGDAKGSKGGAGAGKHIQRTRPPIPRHLSLTGMEVHMGEPAQTCTAGWGHPDPGSEGRSIRATVPECSAGVELC